MVPTAYRGVEIAEIIKAFFYWIVCQSIVALPSFCEPVSLQGGGFLY
jgi:hypothetical protein